ncbi:aminoglycoside N(3)-acetyltransferase [Listeria costaricensis]|uniref:aminoglycoside N(3)-acetyltransferase n=1 Tax=Listeria costaricensis TaxID=2026604 RepID=UPI000C079429|nr:AAC(3) family N-acetyltransferase [Listeria costaricensis]
MGEKLAIWKTQHPYTVTRLKKEFQLQGIEAGDAVIFHSAMSKAGWICGGAIALINALQETITTEGNLMMASQTGGLTDPSTWENPPVPKEWWEEIRQEMPVFDKDRTPCFHMGVVAETFRALPDVMRSSHPYLSLTAWGKEAEYLTDGQTLAHGLGENSPLAKLYTLPQAKIVLFGVDNDRNTSLHLAEERSSKIPVAQNRAVLLKNGRRVTETFEEAAYDSDRFIEIGRAYEKENGSCTVHIAGAASKIYPMRELVDFAVSYLDTH